MVMSLLHTQSGQRCTLSHTTKKPAIFEQRIRSYQMVGKDQQACLRSFNGDFVVRDQDSSNVNNLRLINATCSNHESGFFLMTRYIMNLVARKPAFCRCENKDADLLGGNLVSVFVFATRIVRPLCFLNPKFQATRHLLWL